MSRQRTIRDSNDVIGIGAVAPIPHHGELQAGPTSRRMTCKREGSSPLFYFRRHV